jgi:hypothetical protein
MSIFWGKLSKSLIPKIIYASSFEIEEIFLNLKLDWDNEVSTCSAVVSLFNFDKTMVRTDELIVDYLVFLILSDASTLFASSYFKFN